MESKIERRFKRILRKIDKTAMCLKFVTPGHRGAPDRLVLMSGARVFFREFKNGSRPLSPQQKIFISQLKALGFDVGVVRSDEDTDEFMMML